MNKYSIRSFAFGILVTVCLIGLVYFGQDNNIKGKNNIEVSKTLLEKSGFVVISKSEYTNLQNKTSKQSEVIQKDEKKKEKVATQELVKKEGKNDEVPVEDNLINYQLEVVSGMTSNEIAKILADQKIVEDEAAFANYLAENGYQTKIQLGSYSLTNKMNAEQIAKMITKS